MPPRDTKNLIQVHPMVDLDAEQQVDLDAEQQVDLDAEQQVDLDELPWEVLDVIPPAVRDGEHGRLGQSQQEPNLLFPMLASGVLFLCST
jgi:hypothetical protein